MTLVEMGDEDHGAMATVTVGPQFLFGIDYSRESHAYVDSSSTEHDPKYLALHTLRVCAGPLSLFLHRIHP